MAADEALADRLRVTWLNEDETTTSFLDLLLRIYRALAAGLHWCYKPNGSFAWSDNDDDPQEDGCSGTTPPGHPRWVSPLEKQAQCWSNHFTDTEITDPETIARLERDEPPEGDDASINRPVDLDTLDSELRKELESSSQQRKRATAHEN